MIRLIPLFRNYLWGGNNLQDKLGKQVPGPGVWAESWEIIDHPEHSSQVANGPLAGMSLREVIDQHASWLLGESLAAKRQLPLLLKYLDCQRVLSVQVHPDDAFALRMASPDLGKTEAWIIIDAAPDAVLYAGLRSGTTAEDLRQAIDQGNVEACLHALHPQSGDCVFIPAGTVHALGAGLLVAEIQQSSNTTFRIFDWDRVDANGQPRALHVEQALQVIDFSAAPREFQQPCPAEDPHFEDLVKCDKFVLRRSCPTAKQLVLAGDDRFHFITVPRGRAEISLSGSSKIEVLKSGESALIPAAAPAIRMDLGDATTVLDMFVPA
ncbi:MAG: class I mannose-6-phosphate isomerase [Planctomycetales bacterium]|nr:class I mannose-6-phosphate isomerase [Planctomycetales bacterium]